MYVRVCARVCACVRECVCVCVYEGADIDVDGKLNKKLSILASLSYIEEKLFNLILLKKQHKVCVIIWPVFFIPHIVTICVRSKFVHASSLSPSLCNI